MQQDKLLDRILPTVAKPGRYIVMNGMLFGKIGTNGVKFALAFPIFTISGWVIWVTRFLYYLLNQREDTWLEGIRSLG